MISSARSARRPIVVAAALALAFATPVLSAAAAPNGGVTCRGEAATFVGTSGRDVFNGGAGRDVVVTLGGNGSDDADGEGGFDTCVAETEDQCEA